MLAPVLRDRLIQKGFSLIDGPNAASYIIQPNITSFVAKKEGPSPQDLSIAGTITGGITGVALSGSTGQALPYALLALAGNVGGAVLGTMFKVQSWEVWWTFKYRKRLMLR